MTALSRWAAHAALMLMLALPGAAFAKPAYVLTTVNLRASAGTDSAILAKIPGGSLVDADNCAEGWCAVTFQDKQGFAIATALDMSGRVPTARPARRQVGPAMSAAPGGGYYVEEPPLYYGPPYYYGGYYRPYWRSYYRPYRWGWRYRRW